MHYGYVLLLFSIICYVTAAPEFYSDRGLTEPHVEPAFAVKRVLRLIKESDEEDTLPKEESLEAHGEQEEPSPVSEEELDEHEEETLLNDQMDQQDQQELQRKKRHLN
uniref:Uncharacterized protein n=1 Tax=Pristhesancus plagipennis TaxID=1955184 RepID=A0A2K8JMC0_PRIPG|nr:secreted hypothetical protein [Pristhesancus plagipennis]